MEETIGIMMNWPFIIISEVGGGVIYIMSKIDSINVEKLKCFCLDIIINERAFNKKLLNKEEARSGI